MNIIQKLLFPFGGKAEVIPAYLAGGIVATDVGGAYEAIGAANLAASYVNLAAPGTNNLTEGVAPTWAANVGWTFNGVDQFLKTGLVYLNAWSAVCRFSGAATTAFAYMVGVNEGNNELRLAPNTSTNLARWYHKGTYSNTPVMNSGVMGIGGLVPYRNGVEDTGGTAGIVDFTHVPSWDLFIGAANANGTEAANFFTGNIQAVYIYKRTLTPAEMLAVSTAMAALP